MGVRLGTVPGWERAYGWTPDNRVYEGVGPTIDIFPEYAGDERAEYWIKFDILFYFCESPPISPVVFRTLKDCMIVQKFVAPLKEPIPIFEKWVEDITNTMIADLAEDIHRMSIIEMGGLRKCGISKEENYAITITDKGFTIAEKVEEEVEVIKPEIVVPKIVIEQLDILEKRLSELEKRKNEINSYIAIAKGSIERFKESGDIEKLSGQEETLKRLVGELTRQNIIIGRQKGAIDKLKSQYSLK